MALCVASANRLAVAAKQSRALPARTGLARPALRSAQVPKRSLVVRAVEEDTTVDVDKLVKDLQQKWDAVENKTSVVLYGAGALVLLWFSSTLVNALNGVPLLPKLMELVGLGYTSWFVYRYLLFKSSREELVKDVDELKKKITGESP